jgi:hypothetical protein
VNQAYGYPHPPQQQHYAPAPSPALAPALSPARPLARLPLQIGTSSTWNATAAALTLLPALALTTLPMAYDPEAGALVGLFVLVSLTLPFIIYAIASLVRARRSRASDVMLFGDGILVDGGPLHKRRVAWNELAMPYAELERATEKRFRLGWLLLGALMFIIFLAVLGLALFTRSNIDVGDAARVFGSPWKRKEITVWRFHIYTAQGKLTVGVTDREVEAWSMQAAVESIVAVMQGRNYVQTAPAVPAQIVTCAACGAPAVPDEAPVAPCAFCRAPVQMPPQARQQAAAVRAMEQSRATQQKIVAKLIDQPRAARVNVRLMLFTIFMFVAWPIAWGLVVPEVVGDGFQPLDAILLAMPFAAVLAGAFLARAPLADRGALQLLTLGFGALAPSRPGEPSRCRRCHGPLPQSQLGGVVGCRYCGADNIVGLDLRPTVGPARAEQATFDAALAKRKSEKTTWGLLSAFAIILLVGWLGGTVAFLVRDLR